VVFPERVEIDDMTETDHFENIYSTNWNSLRFKPPPSFESDIGWRVEFRPMDL
jgi:glutamate--cysteine ligase catalytic subunit